MRWSIIGPNQYGLSAIERTLTVYDSTQEPTNLKCSRFVKNNLVILAKVGALAISKSLMFGKNCRGDHVKDCDPLESHRYNLLIKSIIEEYLKLKLCHLRKLMTMNPQNICTTTKYKICVILRPENVSFTVQSLLFFLHSFLLPVFFHWYPLHYVLLHAKNDIINNVSTATIKQFYISVDGVHAFMAFIGVYKN